MALVKLMPGPVSAVLAVFLGQEVAGVVGGLVSVLGYVLPAFFLLLAIAYFEQAVGPWLRDSLVLRSVLDLLQVAVLAVIAHTCWKLFRDAHRSVVSAGNARWLAAVFALVAVGLARFAHLPEPLILAIVGALGLVYASWTKRDAGLRVEPLTLFMAFFVAGSTVFGTGYMVLPYLHRLLVENHGWLAAQDFSDAVVYGNLTPGPIVIASTYMGFKMGGLGGALASTFGIFAGPVVLMLFAGPIVRRHLDRPWVQGLLLGVLPAVAATILASLPMLGSNLAWTWLQIAVLLGALALSVRGWPIWKVFASVAVVGVLAAFVPRASASEPPAAPAEGEAPAKPTAPKIELPASIAASERVTDCGQAGRLETKKYPFKMDDEVSEIFEQSCHKGLNRHGPTRRWYANGKMYNDFNYANGEAAGLWQSYYIDGKPMMRGEFFYDAAAKKVMAKGQKSFYSDGRVACEYEGPLDPAEQAKSSKIFSQDGKLLETRQYFALCGGNPQTIALLLCEQQGHCDAVVFKKTPKVATRPKKKTPMTIPPRSRGVSPSGAADPFDDSF
jgi:chromate transporter